MKIKKGWDRTIIKGDFFWAAFMIHLLIWVTNLPFSQLQMEIFGRRIFTLTNLGVIECGLLLVIVFRSLRKFKLSKLSFATLLFICMLIFSCISAMISKAEIVVRDILMFVVFWMIPFSLLIVFDQVHFNVEKLQNLILVIIVIHAVMIIIQKVTKSLIWPFMYDESGMRFFYIGSGYYNTDGLDRCPGICISGLNAGVLLIFGWCLLGVTEFKRNIWRWLLAVLFGVAILFTGTRNIYITALYILVYAFVYCYTSGKWRIILCNAFMLLSAILYMVFFKIVGQMYTRITKNILTDTYSTAIRIGNWANIWEDIEQSSIYEILFGQLEWQNTVSINIDNLFLEVFLAIGLVGLIAFCIYFLYLHNYLLGIDDKRFSLLLSFVSALFIYGIANVFENLYMTLILVAVFICSNYRNTTIEKRG